MCGKYQNHFPFVELDEFGDYAKSCTWNNYHLINSRRDGMPRLYKTIIRWVMLLVHLNSIVTKYANSHKILFHWQSPFLRPHNSK